MRVLWAFRFADESAQRGWGETVLGGLTCGSLLAKGEKQQQIPVRE